MSNVVPPRRLWICCRHDLTLRLLSVSACLACLPVRDLSDYSGPDKDRRDDAALPEAIDDRVPPLPEPRGISSAGEVMRAPNFTAPPPGSAAVGPTSSSAGEDSDPGAPLALADAGDARADADQTPPAANGTELDAGSARRGTTQPAPIAVTCASGESAGPSGHCYIIVGDLLTWSAARGRCQSHGPGWELTSIRSPADSLFLHALFAGEVWVGGTDATTEATWTWVNDGFGFWQGSGRDGMVLNDAYVNWYPNEPNGLLTSDCLRLLGDASWADFECTELRASICEGPGQ